MADFGKVMIQVLLYLFLQSQSFRIIFPYFVILQRYFWGSTIIIIIHIMRHLTFSSIGNRTFCSILRSNDWKFVKFIRNMPIAKPKNITGIADTLKKVFTVFNFLLFCVCCRDPNRSCHAGVGPAQQETVHDAHAE